MVRTGLLNSIGTLVGLIVLFSLAASATAHEATPSDLFVTPDPSECQVEPRTLESVTSLAGTPASAPSPTPSAEDAVPADDEVVVAVTAIARESVACFNAGYLLAQFAFYTDEAILSIMPPGLTPDDLAGFLGGEPEALPKEAREAVMVRDVMVHSDGRVTAYFVMRNLEGTFTTFITLMPREVGYVITSDIDVETELATPAA